MPYSDKPFSVRLGALGVLAVLLLGLATTACGPVSSAEHYVLRSHPSEPAFYTPEIGRAGGLEKARAKGIVSADEEDDSLVADWLF